MVDYRGTEYKFFIKGVTGSSISVKLYPIPSRDYTIDEGTSKTMDLDRNNWNDFRLKVTEVSGGQAKVTCEILDESKKPTDDDEEEEWTVGFLPLG